MSASPNRSEARGRGDPPAPAGFLGGGAGGGGGLGAALACAALLAGRAREADAQFLARPFLDWRTLETPRFTFYFPAELEAWTRDVAERIESVDSAVSRVVGFTPPRRTRVIVDDPYNAANGFAIPYVDRPVITLWAVPPSPRQTIGDFRSWGEMLAVHEFAHVAHLARPSRNRATRLYWQLLPVRLGPIATRAPRWAIEGYATFVEGRVTGSGRPNNAARAAFLRQWALEGRLPTYAQLSSWSDFAGGEFAYLAGSAFLEWLASQHGDSSLVHVWRRLTARTTRTFDEAFAGVYGESPRILYARFTVHLATVAVAARDRLAAAGLAEGELVQHLRWGTGDPAISRDGQHAAVVLRSADAPSRLVVWHTAPEPDTMAARAASRLLERDPEDVPARRIYPPPKRPVNTLPARNGRSFEQPRFLPNGRELLVSRSSVRADGSLRPDLYIWNAQTGRVRRVTAGAALRDADPLPGGGRPRAAAVRCARGACDLVLVDLVDGAIRTLAAGSVTTSFYRPRYSPDGRTIAVSVQREGRWRIALLDVANPELRFVDPDDGANRFDVAWLSPDELVLVSDRSGVHELERLDLRTGAARQLTRVTGAAAAPEPNPADGSIWFLLLHSRGRDVRRLPTPAPVAGEAILGASEFPAAPFRTSPGVPIGRRPAGPTRSYSSGTSRSWFWLPVAVADANGGSAGLAIASSDILGRLAIAGTALGGSQGAWRGASVSAAWRGWRPSLEATLFSARQLASRTAAAPIVGDTLDDALAGGALRARITLHAEGMSFGGSLALSAASLSQSATDGDGSRMMASGRLASRFSQSGEAFRFAEHLSVEGSGGATHDSSYGRWLARAGVGGGPRGMLPIEATGYLGRVSDRAPAFERFTLGGLESPLVDPDLLPQRVAFPALPTGAARGSEVVGYRIAIAAPVSPYFAAARLGEPGAHAPWQRAWGLEIAASTPALPTLGTPAGSVVAGIARAIDEPFEGRVQGYVGVTIRP